MVNVKRLKGRNLRKRRVRVKVKGVQVCPRLSVFRSGRYIYVQIIDDEKRVTLAEANSKTIEKAASGETKIEKAGRVGVILAEKAKKIGVSRVVFDRGGYKYHGRVKALAEGARRGGLIF